MSTQVRSQRAARRAALPPARAAARQGRRAGAARPVLQLLRPRGPELPRATRWKTVEAVRPKRRPVLVSAAIGPTLCGLCGHATSRPVWLARVDQPADRAEAGRSVGLPDARFGTESGRRATAEPTCFRRRLAGRLHALHARRAVSTRVLAVSSRGVAGRERIPDPNPKQLPFYPGRARDALPPADAERARGGAGLPPRRQQAATLQP